LEQKMHELNRPEAQPVTETPTAEAPVAISPVMAPSVVAPLSAAPAVAAPAPKVSTAPAAAASVAVASVAATLPSSSPGQVRPANELVTTTGLIYKNVQVERVKEDGIIISYTPAHGGWATTKVYFQDLPAKIRQQYEK
jgi:hypothetical protein